MLFRSAVSVDLTSGAFVAGIQLSSEVTGAQGNSPPFSMPPGASVTKSKSGTENRENGEPGMEGHAANATDKVTSFKEALQAYCRPHGLSVAAYDGPRANAHVMKVISKNGQEIVLYVKVSLLRTGFWGLNANQIDAFRKEGHRWYVVLLLGSGERSYLGTSQEVKGGFRSKAGDQYKVHEKEIKDRFVQFDSYAKLFLRLLPTATPGNDPEAESESFHAQERAAGFQSNPEIRRAVENYAMEKAEEELLRLGLSNLENTSARECYDYTCERDGYPYFVEVKGTQGSGASVILTENEVEHWKNHQKSSVAVIVHDVRVEPEGGSFRASGGTSCVCLPWALEPAALEPIQYRWKPALGQRDH